MKSRTLFLIIAALILGAVYAYKFTDWFQPKQIQISFRTIDRRGEAVSGPASPITFFLGKEYPLTSLKVISVEEAVTNKYPHALWHLVPENGPALTENVRYGVVPAGMKLKIPGLNAEPLQPDTKYLLLVEAGKFKGEKEFQAHRRKL